MTLIPGISGAKETKLVTVKEERVVQHDLKAKMVRMTDSVSEKTQETTEEKHWNTLTLNRNY